MDVRQFNLPELVVVGEFLRGMEDGKWKRKAALVQLNHLINSIEVEREGACGGMHI